MARGYQALTEKEKQTLRLMLHGHDAKSLARHFGLSVHTINERLRDARRKLEVSSSREAARLLHDTEGRAPELLGDRHFGEAASPPGVEDTALPQAHRKAKNRFAWGMTGVALMSVTLGILALASLSSGTAPSPETAAPGSPPETTLVNAQQESEAANAARVWLVLGDERRWVDGWRASGAAFRQVNTVERWTQAAEQVRVPLGALRSRVLLSQDSVPAPPAGVEVVRFRSSFANKPDVVETVSLAREDGVWKVVGIYLT